MNENVKKRIKRTMVLVAIGLFIGAAVGFFQARFQNASVITVSGDRPANATAIAGLQIGGAFSLLDHNGEKVTEKTYEGAYKLVYFGFTFCPDICPGELQKMARILKQIGKPADAITPLFITIDPARDTPEVMKTYVEQFHPRLIGLTGTEPQVDIVMRNYRIFAAKVEDEALSDYTMNHSSYLYLMGRNDEFIGLYRLEDKAGEIAQDIGNKLEELG